jgi:hypothetical protein
LELELTGTSAFESELLEQEPFELVPNRNHQCFGFGSGSALDGLRDLDPDLGGVKSAKIEGKMKPKD